MITSKEFLLGSAIQELFKKIKFEDLKVEGSNLWFHAKVNETAVLTINTESVIRVSTSAGLGEMIVAEVRGMELAVTCVLSYAIADALQNGFRLAHTLQKQWSDQS